MSSPRSARIRWNVWAAALTAPTGRTGRSRPELAFRPEPRSGPHRRNCAREGHGHHPGNPARRFPPSRSFRQPESRYGFLSRIKAWGRGLGLNEAENYSFVGHKDLDHLGLSKEGRIDIINPLTEEQNVLRTEIAPSLLQNVRTNIAHGNMGVRLFEVANVFEADPASQTTAKESARLGMVMYGSLYDTAWPNAEIDAGYADIRGLVEHFAAFLNLSAPVFTRDENTHPFLAPCVRVTVDGKPVGVVGQVKTQLSRRLPCPQAHLAGGIGSGNPMGSGTGRPASCSRRCPCSRRPAAT